MKRLFLSHVEEDGDVGLDLARELELRGYSVWCYERDSTPGPSYLLNIRTAIRECQAVILLASPHSIGKSHQIDSELQCAHDHARPVVPVLYEVTDAEYKRRRPLWAQIVGTATSIAITRVTAAAVARSVADGLQTLDVWPEAKAEIPVTPKISEPRDKAVPPVPVQPQPNPHRARWQSRLRLAAAFTVALLLLTALAMRERMETLVYWIGATAGSTTCMKTMGDRCASGLGTTADGTLALVWYRAAAEAGDVEAMASVGLMYEDGTGGSKDSAQAAKWWQRAAEAGNCDAMKRLGGMYQEGRGVAKSDSAALAWYRKAVDAGDAGARTSLGVMYEYGLGVTADDAEAVSQYRAAAKARDAEGMARLGDMYRYGHGVAHDYNQAFVLYYDAAREGNERGMARLGSMYAYGLGTARNESEAKTWYDRTKDPEALRGLRPGHPHRREALGPGFLLRASVPVRLPSGPTGLPQLALLSLTTQIRVRCPVVLSERRSAGPGRALRRRPPTPASGIPRFRPPPGLPATLPSPHGRWGRC